jgi:hypothetical protein
MEGHLLMSEKERRRKVEFERIVEERMTIRQASQRLELSYRQCRRSYRRYREEGDRGLVHGSHAFGVVEPGETGGVSPGGAGALRGALRGVRSDAGGGEAG